MLSDADADMLKRMRRGKSDGSVNPYEVRLNLLLPHVTLMMN